MRSFANTAQDDGGEGMIPRKTAQNIKITPDKPCIYGRLLKIANLRPIERDLEKNRVNIPAKRLKRLILGHTKIATKPVFIGLS